MKAKKEKIIYPVQSSFKILKYKVPYFDMPFHYHPEYELVYINKGSGLRYIGNSIHKFRDGDMVLIGPGLAHVWVNPKEYQKDKTQLSTEAIVLQFSIDLLSSMIDTPEFTHIKDLLSRSQRGIKINSKTKKKVYEILQGSINSKGITKFIKLLNILDILSQDKNTELLNPASNTEQLYSKDTRINAVYQLVMSFYNRKIGVKEAAEIANMEQSAFCRFFKDNTNKSFTNFLNETRINRACSLLLEKKLSISQVAWETGFNNTANFYRQFNKHTGKTPAKFRNNN